MSELVGADGQAPARVKLQILIEYTPDNGNVSLRGNGLQDRLLAHGMLGVAGDILLEMAQASKREVQPVTGELAQKVLARHAKGA